MSPKHFALAVLALSQVGYSLLNAYPTRNPTVVPLTIVDCAVPLVPWTAWVYLSLVPFLMVCYFLSPRPDLYVKRLGVVVVLGLIAFALYPTSFPRGEFLAAKGSLLHWIWSIDEPNNACPSLHAASAIIGALCSIDVKSGGQRIMIVTWGLAIVVATMTTKQHGLIDACGGGLVALLGIYVAKLATNRA